MVEGTNKVYVRVYDGTANPDNENGTYCFYVKKDTTPPTITYNQGSDYTWRNSSGIFSCRPSDIDWSTAATTIGQDDLPRCEAIDKPDSGTVISYTVNYMKGQPVQAIVLCETDNGERFVSHTRPEDQDVVAEMVASDPVGRRVEISGSDENEYALHFRFAA